MEGVTLIESGTSRTHFAFAKRYEAVKTAQQADDLIITTVAEVESALTSRQATSLSLSSLTSQLLLLLHCTYCYPHTSSIGKHVRPSIQFALVPALHLAATAEKVKEVLIAYDVLAKVFATQTQDEQNETSLLMLNTIREHLVSAISGSSPVSQVQQQSASLRGKLSPDFKRARLIIALRAMVAGVPAGPDIFPALYGPVSRLCHNPDETIQTLALRTISKLSSYVETDQSIEKAIWERSRAILSYYCKAEKKPNEEGPAALPRALLDSIRQASKVGLIDNHAALEAAFQLASVCTSIAVRLTCLQFCTKVCADTSGSTGKATEHVRNAIIEVCTMHQSNYAALLHGTSLLGRLASLDGDKEVKAYLIIWQLVRSHLASNNANRKLLALRCLDALLPLSWFDAGTSTGLTLDEAGMLKLMGMVRDADEGVRRQTLLLFRRIDPDFLDALTTQLLSASQEVGTPLTQRLELASRIVDIAFIRYPLEEGSETPAELIRLLHSAISIAMGEGIDEQVIRHVVLPLRAAPSSASFSLFLQLLDRRAESGRMPSPTEVLLDASLACELDGDGEGNKAVLAHLNKILTGLDQQEAVIIAMMKLLLSGTPDARASVDSGNLLKLEDASTSVTIKKRLNRLRQLLQGDLIENTHLPSGTLLETMDRIDSVISEDRTVKSENTHTASKGRSSKPLRYDTYGDDDISSSSASISGAVRKPFSALAEPSATDSARSRRRRREEEEAVQLDMQMSIAKLTLGNAEEEDRLDEEASISTREGVLF